MGLKFYNEHAKILYERIVQLNEEVMSNRDSISLGKHIILNQGTLLNLCNQIYADIPFSDPPEPYCKNFIEMVAKLIWFLNKGHCFADGNKRTTLLIIMELIKDDYPVFYNDFFKGSLADYLIMMLDKDLNYESILNWVSNQFTLRYDISQIEQTILEIAVNYKRRGFYEEAIEIYKYLITNYGSSSVVYKGIAKVLACNKEYEEAIVMFDKAIDLANENGIDDIQSKYHKTILVNRNSLSEESFKNYIYSISGKYWVDIEEERF